jgi:hypothetical protein
MRTTHTWSIYSCTIAHSIFATVAITRALTSSVFHCSTTIHCYHGIAYCERIRIHCVNCKCISSKHPRSGLVLRITEQTLSRHQVSILAVPCLLLQLMVREGQLAEYFEMQSRSKVLNVHYHVVVITLQANDFHVQVLGPGKMSLYLIRLSCYDL